jgi:hypothetical protein
MIFSLSKLAVRSSGEKNKKGLPTQDQSVSSGVRDIPFKTVFPPFFKIVLNRVALWPCLAMQRIFYHTGLGLVMLAKAQSPKKV